VIAEEDRLVALIEPDETRLIGLRDVWDAEREAERKAKADAEKARVDAIRARIDVMRNTPARYIGAPSSDICIAADAMSEAVISLEEWQEFSGEAQVERDHAVKKLREMQAAQLAAEEAAAEAVRQAEADRIERERVAEQNRIEAKRLADLAAELHRQAIEARARQAEADRQAALERQRVEDEERIVRAKAQAAMLAEQQAHEARLRSEREAAEAELRKQREAEEARLAEQRAELVRQQAAIDAANAERERIEREATRAAEARAWAEQQAREMEARVEAQRIADEQAAEAERREREAAAEAERAALEAEVARLHALHFANDGLGMLEDVMNEIVRPIGQECCGRPGSACCGCPEPVFHTVDSLATELNKWRNELIQRRAEQKEAA